MGDMTSLTSVEGGSTGGRSFSVLVTSSSRHGSLRFVIVLLASPSTARRAAAAPYRGAISLWLLESPGPPRCRHRRDPCNDAAPRLPGIPSKATAAPSEWPS